MPIPLLEIRLLGSPSIQIDSVAVGGLRSGKALALFAFLIREPEATRDRLIGLLWGDRSEDSARNAFRQTLHRLRGALGPDVIQSDRNILRVDATIKAATDASIFEDAIQAGDFALAASSYTGPFLDGIQVDEREFESWLRMQREGFAGRYRLVLEHMLALATSTGDAAKALELSAHLLQTDPLSEELALRHASALASVGRVTDARILLEEISTGLRENLEAMPSPAVTEMLARFRGASWTSVAGAGVSARDRKVLVGREDVISRIVTLATDSAAGSGRTLLLRGGAGVGKTTVVRESVRRIKALGDPTILSGRETPGSILPYASIAGVLQAALDAPGLAGASRHLLAEAALLVPEMRDRFDLPVPIQPGGEGARVRLFEGVSSVLEAVAYEQPLCVILEDFHNASPESIELAVYLSNRLRGSTFLLILVSNSEADAAVCERFAGGSSPSSAFRRIDVPPLSTAETKTLVDAVAGGTLSEQIRGRITSESEGLPFRAIEMVNQAMSGGLSAIAPITLKQSLSERLSVCSPSEQRLFAACALLELPSPLRLLAAAAHIPEAAALEGTGTLETLGLVLQSPQGILPSHDGALDLVMEGSGPAGVALLAGWAADAVGNQENFRPAQLARLYQLAGRREETFRYSMAAALEALAVGATSSVTHYLDAARSTAISGAESAEVDRLVSISGGGRLRLTGEKASPAAEALPPAESSRAPVQPTLRGQLLASRSFIVRSIVAAGIFGAVAYLSLERFAVRGGVTPLTIPDTLFVSEIGAARDGQRFVLTGNLHSGTTLPSRVQPEQGSWSDSVIIPWVNAKRSPDGRYVAVERLREGGSEIFIISADRSDTMRLSGMPGDNRVAGWAPDSRTLLAINGPPANGGRYDTDLWALNVSSRLRSAVDTSHVTDVVDAEWSPLGTHILWTARLGVTRQQEVFVSSADGTGRRNISNNDAEDYNPRWAPDGSSIAYVSDREGNAEIYAHSIFSGQTRRLSWSPAQDDNPVFSPDGVFVAFESTRDGEPAVYITRSFGTSPIRTTPPGRRFAVVRWGPRTPDYIESVSLTIPPMLPTGGSARVEAIGVTARGRRLELPFAEFRVVDPTFATLTADSTTDPESGDRVAITRLLAPREGVARIIGTVGGWRADTSVVQTGNAPVALLRDDFSAGLPSERWKPLGQPLPYVASSRGQNPALFPNGDHQWPSGVLSREPFPLRPGLTVKARVHSTELMAGRRLNYVISLIAPDPPGATEAAAPQFYNIIDLRWIGASGRFAYAVEQEHRLDRTSDLAPDGTVGITIEIEQSRRIAFYVNEKLRWRSTLRLGTSNRLAHLWLAGEGTGNALSLDDIQVTLNPLSR